MSKELSPNRVESKNRTTAAELPKRLGGIALALSLIAGGTLVYVARQANMPEQKPSTQEEIARFVDDYREGEADLPNDAVVETFTVEEGGNIVEETTKLAKENNFSQNEMNHLGESVLTSTQAVYDFNKKQGAEPSSSVEMQAGDQVTAAVVDANGDGMRDVTVLDIKRSPN
ncbi:hypothetical protein TM074_02590 [Candidatus Nanosynbacter sp. TM7-074]|uniref:Uncharacterized protein n=1 Tax=Candidatus Nanosynbacter sp. TM7-074 TaxID=3158573 RepID=A0AB39J7M3_9BACT